MSSFKMYPTSTFTYNLICIMYHLRIGHMIWSEEGFLFWNGQILSMKSRHYLDVISIHDFNVNKTIEDEGSTSIQNFLWIFEHLVIIKCY